LDLSVVFKIVLLIAVPANVFSLENFSKILTTKNKKEYFAKNPLFIYATKNLPNF
jgi:hypothetical protein